ncbi:MAG: FtsX-like permease family protein, partial [Chloracidobacterium sp.]|nr:FtsX-like permease family protein [Chloracidobacterium sp.]
NPQKDEDWMNVVGVVGDVKDYPNSTEAEPAFYWSITQQPFPEMLLTIRADKDPMGLVDAVRREVRAIDRELPISDIRTLDAVTSAAMSRQRLSLILIGFFALSSLALAACGIYGVMSYLVSQRTHELGIRLALGAQVGDVMKLIIRQGMAVALIGISLGLAAALAVTQLMKSLLFGVSSTDPVTYALIALLLVGVALIASYIPARRATKIDPLQSIRHE